MFEDLTLPTGIIIRFKTVTSADIRYQAVAEADINCTRPKTRYLYRSHHPDLIISIQVFGIHAAAEPFIWIISSITTWICSNAPNASKRNTIESLSGRKHSRHTTTYIPENTLLSCHRLHHKVLNPSALFTPPPLETPFLPLH